MISRSSTALTRYSITYNNVFKKLYSNHIRGELVAPPRDVRVVVCGGGVMGASVAYHLSKLGWGNETVLIEQNRVGGGTTWHSSGLIGVFKPSLSQVKLTKSSVELYEELEKKGLSTGWKQCGSLNLARSRDRMTVFRRMKAQSISWGIECELLTPEQCKAKCPLLNIDDIVGGLWIPGDGVGDPYETCLSVVGEAKKMGKCFITAQPYTISISWTPTH